MKITKCTRRDRQTGDDLPAWRVDWTDQTGTRHRDKFPTRRAADAHRVEVEARLRAGTYRGEAAKKTVGQLCEAYEQNCRDRNAAGERMTHSTLLGYISHLRNYIVGPGNVGFTGGISELKLAALSPRQMGDLRDRLRQFGVSVPTTRAIFRTLHAMFEYGRSQDLIGTNPVTGIRVIGRRDEGSRKVVAPSTASVNAAIDVSEGMLRLMLRFSIVTGCRVGEMRALRWKHVDLVAGQVRIETRVDAWGNEDGQGTKSLAGNRTIPIGKKMISELVSFHKRTKFYREDDLIFTLRGKYINYQFLSIHLKRCFKSIEDRCVKEPRNRTPPPSFTWHALRHYAISSWIDAGLAPKVIQTFAGHSSLAVTMDRYGHMFPSETHREAMDQIARSLSFDEDREDDEEEEET